MICVVDYFLRPFTGRFNPYDRRIDLSSVLKLGCCPRKIRLRKKKKGYQNAADKKQISPERHFA